MGKCYTYHNTDTDGTSLCLQVPKWGTSNENKAIKELGKGNSMVVLTVDKGVTIVVMDKHNYLSMAQDVLADRDTYQPISGDPTTRLKTCTNP